MNTEHQTLNPETVDEITSAAVCRLNGSRQLLDDAPGQICDPMNAILDDVTSKLEALADLAAANKRPAAQVSALPDRDRYRRAVSMLSVLLEKMDADDSSGLQACDTLQVAILELQAAGGLEQ